jgi:hypothetical protein
MNRLGETIHHERCGPFLIELIRFVQGRPLRDPAVIYVLGFLLHHVLDRNMHPYIHYKAGYKKWDHQRFEVILDTIMAKKFLGVETWKTPVWRKLDIGDKFPAGVVEMFDQAVRKIFPDLAKGVRKNDWNDAYRDMVCAQRIFHDPIGIKRILTFGKIEPLVYKRTNPPLDYLNESHQVWHHPSIFEETSADSVWDLWEKAFEDGEAVMREAIEYLAGSSGKQSPGNESALIEKIGNLSYDTGKSCDLGLKLLYSDPMI